MEVEITFVVELLLIASLVAVAVKYTRVPYTVALVIVGLLFSVAHAMNLTLMPVSGALQLSKELVFLIFLPPLLFEGAINMDLEILRRNWRTVTLLALIGTVLSTFLVGGALHLVVGFTWLAALLVGAILAPTDPVSVLALFRSQGVDKNLSSVVEGESVFNDGIGVVLFLVLEGALLHPQSLTPGGVAGTLLWETLVGAGIGLSIGFITHKVLGHIEDHLTEVTISLVLAYGVYIVADRIHASGVIAVVCAGLIMGNFGKFLSMSPRTRLTLTSFWEVAAFLVNSLIFLLIGMEFRPQKLWGHWDLVFFLFGALLVFRAIIVYGILGLQTSRRRLSWRWLHVIQWGGLRGSIPIALVLGLDQQLRLEVGGTSLGREDIITVVFGVVLLSLLVQGLTISPLLKHLGLTRKSEEPFRYEQMLGRSISLNSALETLERAFRKGEVSDLTYQRLVEALERASDQVRNEMKHFLAAHQEVYAEEYHTISQSILLSQRAAIQEAYHRGMLSEDVFHDLVRDLDARLADPAGPSLKVMKQADT